MAAQQAIISAGLESEDVLSLIVERIRQLTGAGGAAVAVADRNVLVYRSASGSGVSRVGLRMPIRPADDGQRLETARLWRLHRAAPQAASESGDEPLPAGQSLFSMPLHLDQELVGLIEIASPPMDDFGDREVHTLQLMEGFLAGVLKNLAQHEALRQLLSERAAGQREGQRELRPVKNREPAARQPAETPGEYATEWSFEGWFCRFEETGCGPLTQVAIQGLVAAGKIQETDVAYERWRHGTDTKLVLTTVRAAFAAPENAYG
jgi:hypothetical protein